METNSSAVPESSATKRPRVGRDTVFALGSDICSGEFDAGGALPSESDLCKHYGVSRTVIREALNVVESKGLVSRKSRVGSKICPPENWNILDQQVLTWIGAQTRDAEIFTSLLEARRIIEPIAAEFAAERASLSEIAELETALRKMADSDQNIERFCEADVEFHMVLLKASHNRVFQQLGHSFQTVMRSVFRTAAEAAENLDEAIAAHGVLVEALRMRDKQSAKSAVQVLLDLSARDLAIVPPVPL